MFSMRVKAQVNHSHCIAQKIKFSSKDFFNNCDQIRRFLRGFGHIYWRIRNGKFHFLCSVDWKSLNLKKKAPRVVNKYALGPLPAFWGHGCDFSTQFMKKGNFVCLHPLKHHFWSCQIKMFFKTQGSRFPATVTPNKGLE